MNSIPTKKETELTGQQKMVLSKAVKKTVKDYGKTLQLLAKE